MPLKGAFIFFYIVHCLPCKYNVFLYYIVFLERKRYCAFWDQKRTYGGKFSFFLDWLLANEPTDLIELLVQYWQVVYIVLLFYIAGLYIAHVHRIFK
jgi:hypothetical protein